MKLSIIIVNYNVKHFLEQCLYSVRRAIKNIDAEVFVVDNNSIDDSNEMVQEKFPEVKLIANKDNVGFSKANNQAIRVSKGEYVLLLNPDTVVEDDTFKSCIEFMDAHPDAGGLGVKMIDGKGNFLPESKRGLPTPEAAFYKIFGISKLFPKSKKFSHYHLSYLDKDETNEVEILAGAYMMMRKEALDKVGLLDETFFMYGEDIDLSYRIIKGGYKNYYFADARIIHYKGESTKKSSVNYVFVFYNAMIIFAKKHFSQKNAKLFSLLINAAIYFRAGLAIFNRFVKKAILPILDFILIFIGIFFIKEYWEQNIFSDFQDYYPALLMKYEIPSFIVIWLSSLWLSGGYDKTTKPGKVLQGIGMGTLAILVIYALLPESLRFSRALVLISAAWSTITIFLNRIVLNLIGFKSSKIGYDKNKRFVIISDQSEGERVKRLLESTYYNPIITGIVNVNNTKEKGFIGNISQVKEIINIHKINEVIFCSKSISHQKIMDYMAELQSPDIDFKIAPEDSLSIIGSNSIHTSGDLYTIDINSIDKGYNRRNKRLFDIILSFFLITSFPISMLFIKNPFGLLKNIFHTIIGCKSWVGYEENNSQVKLPKIKKGILSPVISIRKIIQAETITKLNLLYARDYKVITDLKIILKGFKHLGRD
ncbi:MAG: glycosyltransferase [Hyphomicrobiales bacterium]